MTQPNNTELKKATIILTDFLAKPESVVPLLQQMEQSQKQEVRQMAAVYLREQVEHCIIFFFLFFPTCAKIGCLLLFRVSCFFSFSFFQKNTKQNKIKIKKTISFCFSSVIREG